MKKFLLTLATVFALTLVFTACNKNNDDTDVALTEDVTTSEDLATAQDLFQSTEDEINYELEERGPTGPTGPNTCPMRTVSPADGSFPRTVTIDYGTDGCEGPDGRVRRGQIIITQSDSMRNVGAVRIATLVDFYVDDAHVQGTKTWTNLGADAEGNVSLHRTVEGASITFPDGEQITWEADHTITQIAGGATPQRTDDVVQITGGSNGVNRNGVAYSNTISDTDPLVKRHTCPWVESGTLTMTIGNRTRSLNYGEGVCDRFAFLTLNNGQTIRIQIRNWWIR